MLVHSFSLWSTLIPFPCLHILFLSLVWSQYDASLLFVFDSYSLSLSLAAHPKMMIGLTLLLYIPLEKRISPHLSEAPILKYKEKADKWIIISTTSYFPVLCWSSHTVKVPCLPEKACKMADPCAWGQWRHGLHYIKIHLWHWIANPLKTNFIFAYMTKFR